MKTVTLNVIFVFFTTICSGQNHFQKLIPIDSSSPFSGNAYAYTGFASLFQVIETIDGGFLFAANSKPPGGGLSHNTLIVTKTDSIGNILWTKQYDDFNPVTTHYKAIELPDSGFIFAGYTQGGTLLVRIDKSGLLQYAKKMSSPTHFFNPTDIQLLNDTTLLLGGGGTISPTYGQAFMICDFNGNVSLSKYYLINNHYSFSGRNIFRTSDGGLVMVASVHIYNLGITPDRFLPAIIKTDSLGNVLWSHQFDDGIRSFNPNPWSFAMQELTDGSFIITGNYYIPVFSGAVPNSTLMIKLDTGGQLQWSKKIDTLIYSQGLVLKDSNEFVLTGSVADIQYRYYPCYLIYDYSGNLVTGKKYAPNGLLTSWSNNSIICRNMELATISSIAQSYDSSYIFIRNSFSDTTICDQLPLNTSDSLISLIDSSGASGYNLSFTSSPVIFYATIDSVTPSNFICNPFAIGLIENNNTFSVSLYPNPAINKIIIDGLDALAGINKFYIINVLGEKIMEKEISELRSKASVEIDITKLPCGIYFLTINSNYLRNTYKFIKQ